MHTRHPDVHAAGLSDGCPSCAEIAHNPAAHADEGLLRQLVGLAVDRDGIPVGEAQAYAVAQLLTLLERVGRIAEAAPDLLKRYLRERWRIACRIEGTASRVS